MLCFSEGKKKFQAACIKMREVGEKEDEIVMIKALCMFHGCLL